MKITIGPHEDQEFWHKAAYRGKPAHEPKGTKSNTLTAPKIPKPEICLLAQRPLLPN
jgi:hypothetical protein